MPLIDRSHRAGDPQRDRGPIAQATGERGGPKIFLVRNIRAGCRAVPARGERGGTIRSASLTGLRSVAGLPAPAAVRRLALAAVTLLFWSGAAGLAMAQTADGKGDVGAAGQPCRVEPDDRSGETKGAEGKDESSMLEDCNGVLVPPKIGDQELVEPPPKTGTMPVIPPGALPQQPGDPEPPR